MEKKKKKNALGWWQKLNAGDPEKNTEIFNHIMTDHPNINSEASGSSSDAAMAEAIRSIRENPETNLEAIKALNELDEIFISPRQLDIEYKKHVEGNQGEKFAGFTKSNWSKEQYEKEAERLQDIPVDKKGKSANVWGFANGDGTKVKYFPKDNDKLVFYRQYKDGSKRTISFYPLFRGEHGYILRKMHNKFDTSVNSDPNEQRDLEIGESYE